MSSDKKNIINGPDKHISDFENERPSLKENDCDPNTQNETKIKNAHAAGNGAIGRNDEAIPDSDIESNTSEKKEIY